MATDQNGGITWHGGFEPFGTDYQAGTGDGASDNGISLRLPGQWVDDTWVDATSGAEIYYNVWRSAETFSGRYTRPDPVLLGRALHAYTYADSRPIVLLDSLGLQTTSSPAPTGDPASDTCCAEAQKKNFFGQLGAAGIVVCCNGRKVACALVYSDPRLTQSGKLAQQLWTDCTFKHEGVHVQDLPDCPSCQKGPTPVTLLGFPTPKARAGSECNALKVEFNCLEKAKAGCSGDPVCMNALDAKKGLVMQDQHRFGCAP